MRNFQEEFEQELAKRDEEQLQDMDRQRRRDEDKQLKAEHCENCWNGPLPAELSCWPCNEIKRQRILLRAEWSAEQ